MIQPETGGIGGAKMVVGHKQDGNKTVVRAQDPEHPDYGSIELVFTNSPVELRQWVIQDGSGNQTTVILGDMVKGKEYKPSTFTIEAEIARRK